MAELSDLHLYYDETLCESRSCYVLVKYLNLKLNLHCTISDSCNSLPDLCTKLSPLCSVPFLMNEHLLLNDNNTILMYLCDKCNDERQNLFPTDFAERVDLVDKLFFANNVLLSLHCSLMTDIVKETFSEIDFEMHSGKIKKAYDYLESLCTESYMCNKLSIVDIAYFSIVSGLAIVFPVEYEKWPNLYNWYDCLNSSRIGYFNSSGLYKQCEIIEKFGKFRSALSTRRAIESLRLTDLRSFAVCANWPDIPASVEENVSQSNSRESVLNSHEDEESRTDHTKEDTENSSDESLDDIDVLDESDSVTELPSRSLICQLEVIFEETEESTSED